MFMNKSQPEIVDRNSEHELRVISLDTDYLHSRVLYNSEAVATVAIDPINFYIYFGTFHSDQLPFIGRVKLDGSGKGLILAFFRKNYKFLTLMKDSKKSSPLESVMWKG